MSLKLTSRINLGRRGAGAPSSTGTINNPLGLQKPPQMAITAHAQSATEAHQQDKPRQPRPTRQAPDRGHSPQAPPSQQRPRAPTGTPNNASRTAKSNPNGSHRIGPKPKPQVKRATEAYQQDKPQKARHTRWAPDLGHSPQSPLQPEKGHRFKVNVWSHFCLTLVKLCLNNWKMLT